MTATHTVSSAAIEVAQLHPDTFEIGENVRDSVDLSQTLDFVESIRENGVLEAISAVRTADGTIVVRDGQRRTFPRKWSCCIDVSWRKSLPESVLQWLTDAGWDTVPAFRCPDHATQ